MFSIKFMELMPGSDAWKNYFCQRVRKIFSVKKSKYSEKQKKIFFDFAYGLIRPHKLGVDFDEFCDDIKLVDIREFANEDENPTAVLQVKKARTDRLKNVEKLQNLISGLIVRPAKISDYVNWLIGYQKNGGKITQKYDSPTTIFFDNWFVVEKDFTVIPLFGSSSVNIIVPEGVDFLGKKEDLGHSNLYFVDGFKTMNNTFDQVFEFSDIKDLKKIE